MPSIGRARPWRPRWSNVARHRRFEADGPLIAWRAREDARVSLNEGAEAVWRLCDGTRSIDEIVDAIRSAAGDADGDAIRRGVDAALASFVVAGLMDPPQESEDVPAQALLRGSIHDRSVCVVSERHRFVYLTTPKNASSSLKRRLTEPRYGGEIRARADVEPQVWDEYFTFAFLRDPVERLLAAYREILWRMRQCDGLNGLDGRAFTAHPAGMPRFLVFLDELERDGPWEEHATAQCAFFAGRRVDYWGHVETIDADLATICKRLALDPPEPLGRARTKADLADGRPDEPRTVADLGTATIERIRALYQEDLLLIDRVRPDRTADGFREAVTADSSSAGAFDILLTDGVRHRVQAGVGDPLLGEITAELARDEVARARRSRLIQLPLNGGACALAFPSLALRGLVPVESVERPGHHPATHVGEGHLGGYLRSRARCGVPSAELEHGDPATWYPRLWRWLVEELGIRSVLDVGCGEGHSTAYFRDLGCEILGVDGSLQAHGDSRVPEAHVVHDFTRGPYVPERAFDLVWSCEFVEHVEERFANSFLASFASSERYLLITHAVPGQPGWHHVNCRNPSYWIEKIEAVGFGFDAELTQQTRELAGHGHFAAHGLAFVRKR